MYCSICKRSFLTASNYRRHINEMHSEPVASNDGEPLYHELFDNYEDFFDDISDTGVDDQFFLSDNEEIEDVPEEVQEFNHHHSWDSNPYYPFKNEIEMNTLMFFKSSQDRFRNRLTKRVLRLLRKVVEISHKQRDILQQRPAGFNPVKDIPTDHCICKSHDPQRNFPRLAVTTCQVPKEGEKSVDIHLIKPSNHLSLIISNPNKVKLLEYGLPNYTADQHYTVNQGELPYYVSVITTQGSKWKDNYQFQDPMIAKEFSSGAVDYWVGDVVQVATGEKLMLDKFFTEGQSFFCVAYKVEALNDNTINNLVAIERNKVTIPFTSITNLVATIQQVQANYVISTLEVLSSGTAHLYPPKRL
ncbi:unnamed protein product [Mucor hiemalis]